MTMRRTGGFPDPPRGPEHTQLFALPVVCFRRACPFLMAWSTFFFLFTISSFKAWRERQIGVTRLQAGPPVLAEHELLLPSTGRVDNRSDTCPVNLLLLRDLLGLLGPKGSNPRANPSQPVGYVLPTTRPCISHNLTLEKSLHGPRGAEADGFLGGQPGLENPPGF